MASRMAAVEAAPTREFVWSMVREDGTLPASELYDVAEACGYGLDQVRLCVARLRREGDFVQVGRGRRAILTATREAKAIAEPELDFLALGFRQDTGEAPWDDRWHLASFSIEESRRTARNALRGALRWTGAPLAGGVYVSAHPWEERIRGVAEKAGVADRLALARVEHLEVGAAHDPPAVAAALWPLERIAAAWEDFARTYEPVVTALDVDRAVVERVGFLADVLSMTNDFAHCLRRDPLLPPELLPRGWPARRARELVLATDQAFRAWRDAAGVPAFQRRYDAVLAEFVDRDT